MRKAGEVRARLGEHEHAYEHEGCEPYAKEKMWVNQRPPTWTWRSWAFATASTDLAFEP